METSRDRDPHHVVIIGGGFAGLYAAKSLGRAPVSTTLVDKRNFHLFQPLLYQVATGYLSPGDIASPLRSVLRRYRNTSVLLGEVVDIIPDERKVILSDGQLTYDTLIVATGATPHYFGHDDWRADAPGLKTLEDALDIRRRVLLAFETAERETDPEKRQASLTFVVVGGGATGVELSGTLGELAHDTLINDFRSINPAEAKILLLEGGDRILPGYPLKLSIQAESALARLGVTVQTQSMVTDIADGIVSLERNGSPENIQADVVLWAAGLRASPIADVLAQRAGASLDRMGRVVVEPDLTIQDHPDIAVIGDLANFPHHNGNPLPGVAPVAMQQGRYIARLVRARLDGKSPPPFIYKDKGTLAVIGRNIAIARVGRLQLAGFMAWLLWVFVHIAYLIEFENRVLVLLTWVWNYVSRKRGARVIMGEDPFPLV